MYTEYTVYNCVFEGGRHTKGKKETIVISENIQFPEQLDHLAHVLFIELPQDMVGL